VKNRVAVEKLLPAKFAKIKSRQDALQATLSVFLDIFYLPNFWDFEENGLFQHPLAITLIDPGGCSGGCSFCIPLRFRAPLCSNRIL
jgi:hypothetical protein